MSGQAPAQVQRKIPLRAASVIVLCGGGIAGFWVGLVRGLVPAPPYVDCIPPVGYTGGGYRCYSMGHPHVWLAVLIFLVSLVASAWLWFISNQQPWPTE